MRLPTKSEVVEVSVGCLEGAACVGAGYFSAGLALDSPRTWAILGGELLGFIVGGIVTLEVADHRRRVGLWPYPPKGTPGASVVGASTLGDDKPETIVVAPNIPPPPKNPPRPNGVRVIDGPLSPIDGYYYLDEDCSSGALLHLMRKHKFNVISTYDADRAGSADEGQLRFSGRNRRRLITSDRDFLALRKSGIPHAGIIYCPKGPEWFPEILRVCLSLTEAVDA